MMNDFVVMSESAFKHFGVAFKMVDKPFTIVAIEAPVRGNSNIWPLRCLPFCSGRAVCRPSGLACDEYGKFYD